MSVGLNSESNFRYLRLEPVNKALQPSAYLWKEILSRAASDNWNWIGFQPRWATMELVVEFSPTWKSHYEGHQRKLRSHTRPTRYGYQKILKHPDLKFTQYLGKAVKLGAAWSARNRLTVSLRPLFSWMRDNGSLYETETMLLEQLTPDLSADVGKIYLNKAAHALVLISAGTMVLGKDTERRLRSVLLSLLLIGKLDRTDVDFLNSLDNETESGYAKVEKIYRERLRGSTT